MATQLETLPPLIVPFGSYRIAETAEVFGFQNINRLATDLPLILFHESEGNRMGVIVGEGLWLWRIQSYLQYGNEEAFNTFLSKTAQYLMARKDKRFFRVSSEGEYNSSKAVVLKAELFNASYELINEPDVSMILTNEEGEQFNHIFSPDGTSYRLDLDRLPVGVYEYAASVTLGKNKYKEFGEFVVTEQSLEGRNLRADHGLLYRMAEKQNGSMLFLSDFSQLPEILSGRTDLKNKVYFEEQYTGLQNLFWLFIVLILLLGTEWFFRKYFGGY